MATASNGSINAKFTPAFEPEQIALKFAQGKPVHSQYQGDQVMFTLTDNRKWFADLYVAQKLEQMRIAPGEIFAVSKGQVQRGGRSITEVIITAVVPEQEPERKPVAVETSASASHLSRCYRDAVDVVVSAVEYAKGKGLAVAPSFEDIRALAATICINESKGTRAA